MICGAAWSTGLLWMIAGVLAALFVLSTAEVFADNSSQTLLPMLVARDDLVLANLVADLVYGLLDPRVRT